jgi:phospholipase/carboxylesterase
LNNQYTLSCVEIDPPTHARYTVIWLHGLGADGHNFAPIVPALRLPPESGVRFVFPHAPIRAVTLNQGTLMRAWFDIYELSIHSKIDREGITAATQSIQALIEKEIARGILSHHIFLAGFSQGAAMALIAGLQHDKPLAGLIALSGFLPLAPEILGQTSTINRQLPIFIAHGKQDPIVPFEMGQMTYEILLQAGYPLSWHTYAMSHMVCDEEVEDISHWIKQRLADDQRNTAR